MFKAFRLTTSDCSTSAGSGGSVSDYRESLLAMAREMVERLQKKYDAPVVVEVLPLKNFVTAEPEHQDYLENNLGGYCHINLSDAEKPLIDQLSYPKADSAAMGAQIENLKNADTLAFNVTQNAATERPFTSSLNAEEGAGIYVDIVSGEPLFTSNEKYDAGCGWPSFTRSILTQSIAYNQDNSLGMQRIETKSAYSGSHLGHVFGDGPEDQGGLRYCINGAALRFIPLDAMEEEDYGDFIVFVKYR